jgi:hypothetical protein
LPWLLRLQPLGDFHFFFQKHYLYLSCGWKLYWFKLRNVIHVFDRIFEGVGSEQARECLWVYVEQFQNKRLEFLDLTVRRGICLIIRLGIEEMVDQCGKCYFLIQRLLQIGNPFFFSDIKDLRITIFWF